VTGLPLKLGAFAGALVLAFAGAYVAGAGVSPVASAEAPEEEPHGEMPAESGGEHGGHDESGKALPGLAVSESGYTLTPVGTTLSPGPQVPFRFTVTGPDGRPVTRYDESHEKELHLIVVRRDLSGFQHVHPVRGTDGTWSVPLDLRAAGTWRVFADFVPTALGRGLTLGADISVPGSFTPVPLPAASTRSVSEGYAVSLTGKPEAGKESELAFTITRNGRPVTDLEPYLGAFGHLVSLRGGDLAYLHTHPAEEAHAGESGGPEVRFATTFPTAGAYRLYLDFQHAGVVRTAEFTVVVGEAAATPQPTGRPATPKPAATPKPSAHATTPHGHS
jgi:hypothetical protein